MDILRSLAMISSDFTVFEKDQVLTHDQLNSLADYLDDQGRLTRVSLLGVGIVCGMRVSVQGKALRLSPGVGVTTDGDIFRFGREEHLFDAFKAYDEANPRYAPFFKGETMIPLYELLPKGETDPRAKPLGEFTAGTGKALGDMAALLLMESYVKDPDLCSGTDCDNLGQECKNVVRLLLTGKDSLSSLQATIPTPHDIFTLLHPIPIPRPELKPSLATVKQLAGTYHAACTRLHESLARELSKIWKGGAFFLSEIFPSDPTAGWTARLTGLQSTSGQSDAGIQYYYGFLKDLAETFNRFRDLLFGDRTLCCPDVGVFPKHLLLGNLAGGSDPEEHRTPFYPSPLASRTGEMLDHARFLARKIHTLIHTFEIPAAGSPIRITPSRWEEETLEERAIPCYYAVKDDLPVHRGWNHRLHRRGMDAWNHGYHAPSYGGQGSAADPLSFHIGAFPFFRIEGHLGEDVSKVLDAIEGEIRRRNLPIAARAVLLGTDRKKVVRKPGIRYTDLHRFHKVLRQDVLLQLEEVTQFSGTFKKQIDTAVAAKVVTDESDGPPVGQEAEQKDAAISAKAKDAGSKLARTYSEYRKDPSWQSDLRETLRSAGEFKYNLGKVVKTEFTTPFDSLIGSTHLQWLHWFDEIIADRDGKEDEKLLFTSFLARHPGLEHFAGVSRGGTFVLVHDPEGRVVADFMLPYYCDDTAETVEEPLLTKPDVRPPWIVEGGIKVLPSLDKFVTGKLEIFKGGLENTWTQKLDLQKDYLKTVKDSFALVGEVFKERATPVVEGIQPGFTDKALEEMLSRAKEQQLVLDYLNQKAAQPDLPADTLEIYKEQIRTAESDLAAALNEATKYVAEKDMDVSVGSQGLAAMIEISRGVETINDTQALASVTTTFTQLQDTTPNTGIKLVLGNMLRR